MGIIEIDSHLWDGTKTIWKRECLSKTFSFPYFASGSEITFDCPRFGAGIGLTHVLGPMRLAIHCS